MERATIRVPEQQLDRVETLVEAGNYPNRSEAIRAAIRQLLEDEYPETEQRFAYADGGRRDR